MPEPVEYFNSAISVNCAVFAYDKADENLKILLIHREFDPYKGLLALPGGLVYPNESLDNAVENIVKSVTGIDYFYSEQVRAFTDTNRHPSGRVVSIAYLCLVNLKDVNLTNSSFAISPEWYPIHEKPNLVFDHDHITDTAYQRLQNDLRIKPLAFELLNSKFTLPQLQTLYEVVLNTQFDKRNFRRKLAYMDYIEDTKEVQKYNLYRPAKLYRFNHEKFSIMRKKGSLFSI